MRGTPYIQDMINYLRGRPGGLTNTDNSPLQTLMYMFIITFAPTSGAQLLSESENKSPRNKYVCNQLGHVYIAQYKRSMFHLLRNQLRTINRELRYVPEIFRH